jgi:hypothetical protein
MKINNTLARNMAGPAEESVPAGNYSVQWNAAAANATIHHCEENDAHMMIAQR